MTDPYTVDWAEAAPRLATAARDDAGWYRELAAMLVRSTDRTAVDFGCGGAGMAEALAAALGQDGRVYAVDGHPDVLDAARARLAGAPELARIAFVQAEIGTDPEVGLAPLRAAGAAAVDVVWAAAAVHHVGDQQAAATALAGLLAPGGRLALAEDGLRARQLPWDVGVGEPGLEMRLDAAADQRFARIRAVLPGAVRMPYGWPEALRRAGLTDVTTRTTLFERPLTGVDLEHQLEKLGHAVDRLRPDGTLATDDLAAWDRLLDRADPAWLGHRTDLFRLEARSVHIGVRKAR